MKLLKKNYLISILVLFSLVSCSSFQAKRVGSDESDEKALEITDNWVQRDTETVVKKLVEQMHNHRGFKKYLRGLKRGPRVFIGEIQNLSSEAYFPINDLNDEFLNEISQTGDFVLVDAAARDAVLKEITYQHDGMVDPKTAKLVGKQTGADLMIFGNVYMRPETRGGKKIKQYSVNLRMTDIERAVEVLRVRTKISKYSEQSKSGW